MIGLHGTVLGGALRPPVVGPHQQTQAEDGFEVQFRLEARPDPRIPTSGGIREIAPRQAQAGLYADAVRFRSLGRQRQPGAGSEA